MDGAMIYEGDIVEDRGDGEELHVCYEVLRNGYTFSLHRYSCGRGHITKSFTEIDPKRLIIVENTYELYDQR